MKVVFISSILPSGHYSQYLTAAINKQHNTNLIIYTDRDPRNLGIQGCGTIKNVWSKSYRYLHQIIREFWKDQPDIVLRSNHIDFALRKLLPYMNEHSSWRTPIEGLMIRQDEKEIYDTGISCRLREPMPPTVSGTVCLGIAPIVCATVLT